MTVKTLTGPSIQDALAKARRELGDDVVLLESTSATADAPAEIAVAIDPPVGDRQTTAASKGTVPKPPGDGESMSVPDTGLGEQTPLGAGLETERGLTDGFGNGGNGLSDAPDGSPDGSSGNEGSSGRDFEQVLEREESLGRGQIFSNSEAQDRRREGRANRPDQGAGSSFGGEGQRRGHPRSKPAKRWAQHPLYKALVDKGLKPDTVVRLFDDLSDRGVDPTGNFPGEMRWACAKLLFQRIDVAGPDQRRDNLLLMGPGGAGKTSLILKMATHDRLLVGGTPIVVHLQPEADRLADYQNPTSLYEKFGVPVRNVRTREDLDQALRHTERFGRVLIDTPPLPLPLDKGRSVLRRIQSILRPLRPLNVHFVVNATRALHNLDATVLSHLPVRPSAVAMTHLDEVSTWGRFVEWLIALNLPIQFVSGGSDVPEAARAFSLEWFVENVMDL